MQRKNNTHWSIIALFITLSLILVNSFVTQIKAEHQEVEEPGVVEAEATREVD